MAPCTVRSEAYLRNDTLVDSVFTPAFRVINTPNAFKRRPIKPLPRFPSRCLPTTILGTHRPTLRVRVSP